MNHVKLAAPLRATGALARRVKCGSGFCSRGSRVGAQAEAPARGVGAQAETQLGRLECLPPTDATQKREPRCQRWERPSYFFSFLPSFLLLIFPPYSYSFPPPPARYASTLPLCLTL